MSEELEEITEKIDPGSTNPHEKPASEPLADAFTEKAPASTPTNEFQEIVDTLKDAENRASENPWVRPKG